MLYKKYVFFSILFCIFYQNIQLAMPGSLDTSFNTTGIVVTNIAQVSGTVDVARAITIDNSGKFVVAGTNGTDFAVARYTSTGLLDTTFANVGKLTTDMGGFADIAYGIAIDSYNKIVVVGTDGANFAVARYTSIGILDTSFGDDGKVITQIGTSILSIAYGVVIDSSDNIIVVGTDGANFIIARYVGTGIYAGQLDTTFGAGVGYVATNIGATDIAYAVALQSNGKIVVAGSSGNDFAIVRYLTNGKLDTLANGGTGFGYVLALLAPGYVVTNISSTDVAYALALQADGKIVVAGKSGSNYALARYTTSGVLDTTFNSTGKVTTNINGPDIVYAIKIQANGSILAAGSSKNDISLARYTTTGALDISFGAGTGKVITNLGGIEISYGLAITNSGNIVVAGTNQTDFVVAQYTTKGVLDSSGFAVPNGYLTTDIGTGSVDIASACAVQSDGKIVTLGTSENNFTLVRYTTNGILDTTFGVGGIVRTTIGTASVAYAIAIQKDGSIVVVGASATSGKTPNKFTLARYLSSGLLDTTFGQSGYVVTNIGGTSIAYGVVIQTDGKIVVAGKSGTSIAVARYLANGLLDTVAQGGSGFGKISSKKQVGYTTMSISDADIAYGVALTTSGKIVIAGVTTVADTKKNNNTNFLLLQYTSAGELDTGNFGSGLGYVRTAIGINSVGYGIGINKSGKIIVAGTSDNNFAVAQYTSVGLLDTTSFGLGKGYTITDLSGSDVGYSVALQSNESIFVAGISSGNIGIVRYASTGILDVGFGSGGKVVTSALDGTVFGSVGLCIDLNGQIIVSAGISSCRGDFLTARYAGDGPLQVGYIDTTFGVNGTLSLGAIVATGVVRVFKVLKSGKILVAIDTGVDTKLMQLHADYSLDTSFGNNKGIITLSGLCLKKMMADIAGDIYISGQNNATKNFALIKVSSNGSSIIWDSQTISMFAADIRQQAGGRIVCIGKNDLGGIIMGFNPHNGTIDSSFGNTQGYYQTGCSSQVAAIAIANSYKDEIIFAYRDTDQNAMVQTLVANGYRTTANFRFGTPIRSVCADDQIHISIDKQGKIVVVAHTIDGNFVARRYRSDGTDDTDLVTMRLTNPTSTRLEKIISLSDGSTLILGTNFNTRTLILVRLNSSFAIDRNFHTTGLLEQSVLSMTEFHDVAVVANSSNRILIGGGTLQPAPYFTAVYNNVAVSDVIQSAPSLIVSGSLDETCAVEGKIPGCINLHTDLSATQFDTSQAKCIEFSASNKLYYIAADNGKDTQITSMHSYDDTQIVTFGRSGMITIEDQADVSDLFLDATGILNVIGGAGNFASHAGWVKRYDQNNGILLSQFSPTNVLDVHKAIGQQSSTRILIAGQEYGVGTIIAYNSVTGELDKTFGVQGRYSMKCNSVITNMKIGADDTIYVLSRGEKNAIIRKISDDGTNLLWKSDAIIDSTGNSPNHFCFDVHGDVVVGDVKLGEIIFTTYNKTTGRISAECHVSNHITGFASPVISSFVIDADNKILCVGYNQGANSTPFIVRISSAMDGLDMTFNPRGTIPGIQSYTISLSTACAWKDLHITIEGKIYVIGFMNDKDYDIPYLARFYGDCFVDQNKVLLPIGRQGALDLTFGSNGILNLASLHPSLVNIAPQIILTVENGSSYIVFDNGTYSCIIRMTNAIALDATYNADGLIPGIIDNVPSGVYSMMIDGAGRILLTGTNSKIGGWVVRYTALGILDTGFGVGGIISGQMSSCCTIIQQTLGRYIVAGTANGCGVLRAYTIGGILDKTFHSTGSIPGEYNMGILTNNFTAIVADKYDRLVIAYQHGTNIDIARLTSQGYLDGLWNNYKGIVESAINYADNASQIRVVLDSQDNIVVAAHTHNKADAITVVAYDTTGVIKLYQTLELLQFTHPVLTDLVAKKDDKIIVSGYQSGNNPMWIARITLDGILDTSFGDNTGIISFGISTDEKIARVLQALSVQYDGELAVIGYEVDDNFFKSAYLIRLYLNPYQFAIPITANQKPVGTVDITLGKSGIPISSGRIIPQLQQNKQPITDEINREGLRAITVNGVTFFASEGADAACDQVAQAIALQDSNTFVVALDGATTPSGQNKIFINEFDVNGVADTSFNGTGQAQVPHYYQNEYVRDMVTFTTTTAINKAILVGYATNAILGTTNSVMWQYDLSSVALDTGFGGYNGDPAGIVFGGGQQAYAVGQQSTGRIIVSGLDQSGNGLVRGYTAIGKVDTSFGSNSSGLITQGITGIYMHLIDTQNRIVIAYNDGSNNVAVARILADGSGLDSSFGSAGLVTDKISGIVGNTNIKITLDENGNIVVAAVNNSGVDTVLKRYTNSGIIDVTLTVTSANLGGITSFTLTRLLANTNGNVVVVGFDNSANDQLVIFQTVPNLISLDPEFNDTGTPGYLKYIVSTGLTQVATDALIHPDGRIIIVGFEV